MAPSPAPAELGGLLLVLTTVTLGAMVPLEVAVAAVAEGARPPPARAVERCRLEATGELAGLALMGALLLVAGALL